MTDYKLNWGIPRVDNRAITPTKPRQKRRTEDTTTNICDKKKPQKTDTMKTKEP